MTAFLWGHRGTSYIAPEALDETLNHSGRARAMTVFTPIRPFCTLIVRAVFWLARRSLSKGPGNIEKLSFIHFARWGVIRRLPDLGQPPEHLRQPLFMFESNYNGSFDQYIDAFANILTTGMTLFWGTSYGFPRPKPVTRFIEYIHANEFVTDHYYSAYPTATRTMIVSALALEEEHAAFSGVAASLTPELFAARYVKLLVLEQGATERAATTIPGLAPGRGFGRFNRSGLAYAVTSLTPIRHGREAELRAHLHGLATSPFAELPDVHFGRWVIIDELKLSWPGAPRRRTRLQSQYLLFTASVTRPDAAAANALPESFLRQVAETIPEQADAIWGSCVGYPGSASVDASVDYLRRSLLDTLLFHVGYPNATVQQVRQALARHDALVDFARRHQAEPDPATLQLAYVTESASWGL